MDDHGFGGSYHETAMMSSNANEARTALGNVFAQDIDRSKLGKLIEDARSNGTEVPRAAGDPRGGNYIDYAFSDTVTGLQGQNGIRLVVDASGNLVTAMPRFISDGGTG